VLELNIKLTLDADVNEVALAQGLAWLAKAGTLGGATTSLASTVDRVVVKAAPPPALVQARPANGEDMAYTGPMPTETVEIGEAEEGYDPSEDIAGNDEEATGPDITQQYAAAEALVRAGGDAARKTLADSGAAPATETPRRRRRTRAEVAAALDASIDRAEGQSVQQPAAQTAPQPQQQPIPQLNPAFALPPGMTMPPFATTAPTVVQPQPAPQLVTRQTPAMPPAQAQPLPQANGGIMLYDDFRNQLSAFHRQRPGFPFTFMRRPAWLDGTPKARHPNETGRWLQAESVPEEFRARLIAEIASTIGQVQ